jgi:guanylate kinase
LNKAAFELSFKNQFDRIILNDKLENACAEAEKAVRDFLMPATT